VAKFDEFYQAVYLARWPVLKSALLHPADKIARDCFEGFAEYRLDQASIIAAEALCVRAGDQVLDLCAAPGGKALILAERMGLQGRLVANELSSARRMRLKDVIETHVPALIRPNIQVTSFDANQFGLKKKDFFDRALLDAPCSSEQHLLEEDPDQKDWKESRTKQLAMRQYSLICSALLSLKPGGTLVYSTCSISPLENDGVVERLLTRKEDEVKVDEATVGDLILRFGQEFVDTKIEKTKYGFQIFPDVSAGIGPIYFARLRKR
jgi:16S rRNA C967 or C1407 C5-methylase (RsmB/RsmF family)